MCRRALSEHPACGIETLASLSSMVEQIELINVTAVGPGSGVVFLRGPHRYCCAPSASSMATIPYRNSQTYDARPPTVCEDM